MKKKFFVSFFSILIFINLIHPFSISSSSKITIKPQIVVGSAHNLVLKDDGSVWICGRNFFGQSGTTTDTNNYIKVINLSNIIKIDAGFYCDIALKNDGTVWAWGNNENYQLGDGTTIDRNIPIKVSGLNDIIDISAGSTFNLALKRDGTVWGWGSNKDNVLGSIKESVVPKPIKIDGLSDIVSIKAGYSHSLAIKNDGTVWAWGNKSFGRLGTKESYTGEYDGRPVKVENITSAKLLFTEDYKSYVITENGEIYSWGTFDGYINVYKHSTELWKDVENIVVGYDFMIIQKKDGTVYGNSFSPIARMNESYEDNDSVMYRYLNSTKGLVKVDELYGVRSLCAGGNFVIGIKDDSSIVSLGSSNSNLLGNYNDTLCKMPKQIGLSDIIDIDIFKKTSHSQNSSSYALGKDGSLLYWGLDRYFFESDSYYKNILKPVKINGIHNFKSVVTYDEKLYCLDVSGQVWITNRDINKDINNRFTKLDGFDNVDVLKSDYAIFKDGSLRFLRNYKNKIFEAKKAYMGNYNLVLTNIGDLVLADKRNQDVNITIMSKVKDVVKVEESKYEENTLVLQEDGSLCILKDEYLEKLLNKTTEGSDLTETTSPIKVDCFIDVKSIQEYNGDLFFIQNDGTIWKSEGGYQYDANSRYYYDSPIAKLIRNEAPVNIGDYFKTEELFIGNDFLILKKDGTLWGMGKNNFGQLGNGSLNNSNIPVMLKGINNIKKVSVGQDYILALSEDGSVWGWGNNSHGQLGNLKSLVSETFLWELKFNELYKIGDINSDNKIDPIDYIFLKLYVMEILNDLPSVNGLSAADLNGDSEINSIDLVFMKNYFLGIIKDFPINN